MMPTGGAADPGRAALALSGGSAAPQ